MQIWGDTCGDDEGMMKAGTWAEDGIYLENCICAYPPCTVAVERARLLYRILYLSGIDVSREIRAEISLYDRTSTGFPDIYKRRSA